MGLSEKRPRLLFFTVHAAFFVSHRLNLAVAARNQGYEVLILYGVPGSTEMTSQALRKLNNFNLRHRQIHFNSRDINPVNILRGVSELWAEIIRFQPTIVHAISTMPIFMTLLSTFGRRCRRVFAISGLGAIATKRYLFYLKLILKLMTRKSDVFVFQNSADRHALSLTSPVTVEIAGSGTPRKEFDSKSKERLVLFAGRLMKKKGVAMFCNVASIVRAKDPSIKFILAGAADYDHPDAVKTEELRTYDGFADVEYVGYKDDMEPYFTTASMVLYPSRYAEGLSKTLIEGAMHGCVICTFDRVGCREAVVDQVTGVLLHEDSTPQAIAEVVLQMMSAENSAKLLQMMRYANEIALERFSIEMVTQRHMEVYRNGY